MYSISWIFVLSFVIFFVYIVYYLLTNKALKHVESPQVMYPSLSQIHHIIDRSVYFQRMNKADLTARNATSIQSYIKLYKSSLIEFSAQQKQKLLELTEKIDVATEQTKNMYKIPWKFARFKQNIEQGWAHTLGDIIFLSDDFFKSSTNNQMITLLHEQCHVFQRLYPIETHKLIADYWGLTVLDLITRIPLARNNPDINNFVYGKNDIRFFQVYNSSTPKDIADSRVIALTNEGQETLYPLNLPSIIEQREHPYEIMACFLPHLILNKYEQSDFASATTAWMSKYL